MVEFLLILIIGLGLWMLALQIDCSHLRMLTNKQARIIESQKSAMTLLAEAIGADVRKIRARLDALERE